MFKVEDTIALVIDYQEKLLPAMYDKERVLHNTQKLLSGLRLLGIPILMTQQYTKGLGNTVPEVIETVGSDKFFEKNTFSCYGCEEFSNYLKEQVNGKNIIICGIESHICVLMTALELKEAGYQPLLVTDCMSSRKPIDHDMAISRAIQNGIEVTTAESILFELLVNSKHPAFKQVSAIIK